MTITTDNLKVLMNQAIKEYHITMMDFPEPSERLGLEARIKRIVNRTVKSYEESQKGKQIKE